MCLYHLLKQPVLCFSEVFKLCETENLNFAVYFMTDKHSYEQVHLKVEPKSFLYKFLNSGDPLYCTQFIQGNIINTYSMNIDVVLYFEHKNDFTIIDKLRATGVWLCKP